MMRPSTTSNQISIELQNVTCAVSERHNACDSQAHKYAYTNTQNLQVTQQNTISRSIPGTPIILITPSAVCAENREGVTQWQDAQLIYIYGYRDISAYISLNSINFYLYLYNSTHSSAVFSCNSITTIYDKNIRLDVLLPNQYIYTWQIT